MHGHDPHLVAAFVLLAFDLGRILLHRREEGGEPRKPGLFVIEREAQEFVEHVAHFGAEAGQEQPPRAFRAEQTRVEIMRAQRTGHLSPGVQPVARRPPARGCLG
nr:hypothetical protein [Rhizobium sp. G21]